MPDTNGTTQEDLVHIQVPRVHTLSVTVRALRIGTKQVTQAVFRQLPHRCVWDPLTGVLRGHPWGTVQYFWGSCSETHLHVVWQDGDRLCRDCVFDPGTTRPEGIQHLDSAVWDLEDAIRKRALFLCALKVWLAGERLAPLRLPEHMVVEWPCGVRTTLATPQETKGYEHRLHNALWHVLSARSPRSLAHRAQVYEQSNAQRRPPGEGWDEHHTFGTYTPPHRWIRWRPETDSEQHNRLRADITKAYAQLHEALATEAESLDLEALPSTLDVAKQHLDGSAEQWRLRTQELERLRLQFQTVYGQLAALDQLFIAV